MKKFLFVFIALFLLTSCFSSKTWDVADTNVENTGVTDNTKVVNDNSGNTIDNEVDEIDVKTKLEKYWVSLNDCDKLNDFSKKQECVNSIYSSTAVWFLDLDLCSMIESNNDLRIMCNLETIKAKAVKEKNKLICDDIKKIDFTSETTDFTNRIDIFVKECLLKF